MSYDISQPIPQGSDGAQDAENSRISAITDELKRLCAVYEAQRGDCVEDVNRFETEQRACPADLSIYSLFPKNDIRFNGSIFLSSSVILS